MGSPHADAAGPTAQTPVAGLLRVLVVDDEPLARLRLRSLLAEIAEPVSAVVGEAEDAAGALRVLQTQPADLVLLDIAMPGSGGLPLAAQLASQPGAPAVVFVTAHAWHALEAFDLDAVDYLTKPVRRERLQAALRRVAQRRGSAAAGAALAADEPVLVVSDRGRVLRVPLAEVLYLRAELKYVTLRTPTRSLVLDDSLADLEQRLGEGFIRIHRNALVARRAVRALERRPLPGGDADAWAVRVAPLDEWLAVSRRQVTAVRQALEEGDSA
ncbi:MAG TPA: LytTR family DNA-binding domain-containing protein [Rubrivivax sp.]|nr:response regulator transcription factor [Rhodoferax sp.]MCL4737263.1 LytTR family DNA-binding domain-containing protein [Burkholderiaceae bacterium]MCP5288826.1 response regulator transcription factor [Burkholderiaceae bacterium]HMQ71661.1 LytTR family DNA-binding domain-containing protein [Rubrivivax sp.]HMR70812.1 LytTR family DNA-binding domain-containing protein [Rubrivivax sp.]